MIENGRSSFTRGVAIILLAIFLFDVMGAIIKHLGSRYPVPQLSLLRNVFGLIPGVLILYYSSRWRGIGRPLRLERWRLALARGLFVAAAQLCFYLSLVHMEFATASTLAFAGPLFVTALSIPVLGHRVGRVRWLAVATGFTGIVLVMRPGSDVFSWYALLPVGAALGYAASSVSARLFDAAIPTSLINLYALIGAIAGSGAILLATGAYVPVLGWQDWAWLVAMGFAGGAAVFCLISAYRLAEPSSLSPFEYFGIPFAFVLGWAFFDETPFGRLVPGALLIAGGGLLIIWRERSLARRQG